MDAIEELASVIREKPFFALFEYKEILEILSFAIVEHFSFGKYVFKEGEKAQALFYVFSGKLKMIKNVGGKEISLKTFHEGNHFGEQCILEDTIQTSSVISSNDSIIICFPKKDFIKYINEKPQALKYIKNYIKNIALNNFIRLGTGFGAKVPLKYLTTLLKNLQEEKYEKKENIIREGDEGDKFFIIREGICEVLKINDEGKQISVVKLEKGSYFGEVALFKNELRNATIRAFTDCTLLTLSKEHFLEFYRFPGVAKVFDEKLSYYSKLNEAVLKPKVDDEISSEAVNIDKLIREAAKKYASSREDNLEDLKKFKRRGNNINSFPVILQQDLTDCGAACLAMICKFYGKRVSLSYLRDITNVTFDGASMLSVADAAEKMGFFTRGVNIDFEGLKEVLFPVICHWGGYHWIVVYSVINDYVYTVDPAKGKTKIHVDEFKKNWSNIALLLDVSPSFTNKPIGKSSFKHFLPVVSEYKVLIFELFIATFILTLFGLASPFFTQTIIDEILVHHDKELLHLMLIGMIILFIFQTILSIMRSYMSFHISTRINLKLFVNFFQYLCSLPLIFFKNRRIGDINARFAENKKIQKFLMGNGINLIIDLLTMIIYLLVMFNYSFFLTIIFMSFISVILFVTLLVTPKLKRMTNDIFQASADQSSQLLETLQGIDTIKSMALEIPRRWTWEARYIKQLKCSYRHFNWETVLRISNKSLNFASTTMILYVGALLVADGKMTIGQLMAFNGLTGAVLGPLSNLINLWDEIQEVKVALDRLGDVFNSDPETAQDAHERIVHLNSIEGLVEFENVSFKYGTGDAPFIIRNLTLTVYPGQKIAIVGRSGSGKTTLVKMIPKLLYPTEGVIRIDGIDIQNLDTSFLRSNIGFILQESFIFSGTIYENIAMNRYWVTPDIAMKASKLASAHEFVAKFPNGYNTVIGESGISLSGGQKQRIAIARQLVANPKILILDEATSALDSETEKAIQNNLTDILKHKSAFIIAHRLSTIRNADLIIVLDQGTILEQGKHAELMAREGLYYYLNTTQLHID